MKDLFKQLSEAYALISTPIYLVDSESHLVLMANDSAEELTGLVVEKLKDIQFEDLFTAEDMGRVANLISNVSSLEALQEHQLRIRKKSKRILVVDLYCRAFNHSGSKILIISIHDVTDLQTSHALLAKKVEEKTLELQVTNRTLSAEVVERKKAQEIIEQQQAQMISTSKLLALGEMAGSMAHEINNPLSIIQGYSQMLRQLISAEPIDLERISVVSEKIETTTERIAEIVSGLRTFSRDGSNDDFTSSDLNKIIVETFSLCQEKLKQYGIKVEMVLLKEEIGIMCRSVQISQVILNLLNNAFDAIEGKSDSWIRIESFLHKTQAEVRITNSGPLIEPSVKLKLFQPFFTTKDIGKGTGLGLSVSRGIVQNHGGQLFIDEESKNTCFVVKLPRSLKA